jgi:hypothetical protein
MAIVGSFLLSVTGGLKSSAAAQAADNRHMHDADQAGIEELHRKDVAATLASDPQSLPNYGRITRCGCSRAAQPR